MANEFIGREIEVGVAIEATRGTAESSPAKSICKMTASIQPKSEKADNDCTNGSFAKRKGRRVTTKFVEGELEMITQIDVMGYMYASLYGIVQSSVVAGSVYDHEFTLDNSILHPSLTVFAKEGSVNQAKYAGCVVSDMELTATPDDYVKMTATFRGSEEASDSSSFSYDTEYDFIGRDVEVKIADTEAGLSGATALTLKEVTITHAQGDVPDPVLGSYYPDNYNKGHEITGSFTLNYTDETFKDLNLGDSSKYMQISITGEANIGGGNNPTLTYVFNNVQITDWDAPDGGADELVTQEVSFQAYDNTIDNEQSKVTLRNLTSSYANVPSS